MAKTLVYEMYPISWECYGGLSAMTKHLRLIKQLKVDYVWLAPLYPSPRCDHGYDVADYMEIDPRFGMMADFEKFVEAAHQMGIKVLMDLVLNHTSTNHKWFMNHPKYYCWSKEDMPGWHNLFNAGPAWEYSEKRGEFYLHLFHEKQADLRWFDGEKLNGELVEKFQEIVDFWTLEHHVDGFRLDVPQAINKDFADKELALETLIFGDKAARVLNAIFSGKQRDELFLMMECIDPTLGELTGYYADNTPVNFVANMLLKDKFPDENISSVDLRTRKFRNLIMKQTQNPHFMLELESHDAPRFGSRTGSGYNYFPHQKVMELMFDTGAQAACLYQGQEIGLENPSKEGLSDKVMLELDAQTAMRYANGESLDDLRLLSRANARVPLPRQVCGGYPDDLNYRLKLNSTIDWIHYWKD